MTPVLTPAPRNGWNTGKTTVTWTATDPNADTSTAGSGVGGQPTTSTDYTNNGVYSLTAPTFTDRVGNQGTVSGSPAVQIDGAAPTITGTRTPAANGFNWNNSPVTVNFSCVDNPATNASGIAAPGCPAKTTVSTDGTNQSVTGNVSDVAGNSASATINNINIDTVKPTLTGTPTTSPNTNGWYNGDVTIHWTANDDRSGVDPATVPGDNTISSAGTNVTVSASVSDKAGNAGSGTSTPVNIDKTPPVTRTTGRTATSL
jgi:hypothetical protein